MRILNTIPFCAYCYLQIESCRLKTFTFDTLSGGVYKKKIDLFTLSIYAKK